MPPPLWIIAPPPDLIEPVPAMEIYIDDIAAVELNGSCARVVCCTYEMTPGADTPLKITKVVIRHPATVALRAAGILNAVAQRVFYDPETGPNGLRPTPRRHSNLVRVK